MYAYDKNAVNVSEIVPKVPKLVKTNSQIEVQLNSKFHECNNSNLIVRLVDVSVDKPELAEALILKRRRVCSTMVVYRRYWRKNRCNS